MKKSSRGAERETAARRRRCATQGRCYGSVIPCHRVLHMRAVHSTTGAAPPASPPPTCIDRYTSAASSQASQSVAPCPARYALRSSAAPGRSPCPRRSAACDGCVGGRVRLVEWGQPRRARSSTSPAMMQASAGRHPSSAHTHAHTHTHGSQPKAADPPPTMRVGETSTSTARPKAPNSGAPCTHHAFEHHRVHRVALKFLLVKCFRVSVRSQKLEVRALRQAGQHRDTRRASAQAKAACSSTGAAASAAMGTYAHNRWPASPPARLPMPPPPARAAHRQPAAARARGEAAVHVFHQPQRQVLAPRLHGRQRHLLVQLPHCGREQWRGWWQQSDAARLST